MKIFHKTFIYFILIFLLISCHKNIDRTSLARVHNKYLYISDFKDVVPAGISKQDSMQIVKNYIDNWVLQSAVEEEADRKLSSSEKDFAIQLENYRRSLLVYQYDKNLVNHFLDTIIKDQEVTDYYNKNQKEFELKDNIVKVIYVKLLKNSPNTSRFKGLIMNIDRNSQNRIQLANLAPKLAVNYFLDDQSWLLFDDLLKEVPVKTYNQEQFLQNNRYIEISDNEFIYMMLIEDFKIKESASPLSFETENIKKVILQKRKLKLLQQKHSEIYNKALNNKDIEIFRKQ